MSRFRQIYNIWGVFAGPVPATGLHFEDYNGEGHNDTQLGIFDFNRLKQIDRVNSFVYGFDIEKVNVTQLGLRSLVDRVIVNRPTIQVSFDYALVGVRNEARLGFVVNYPDVSGNYILNEDVCCFNNFTGQNTDYRNIFVAVSPDNTDLNDNINNQFTDINEIDPKNLFVFAFGNCYLNSYNVSAAVGTFPQASVGYLCDNVMAYASGSGMNIPAVHPKSGNLISGIKFTIPRAESVRYPSVIRPGDITLKIGNISGYTINEATDALFGVNSSGLPIQAFNLNVGLVRDDLRSIGYALPINRKLTLPIIAQLDITTVIGDNYSGNLVSLLNQNKNYDILINMFNNTGCDTPKDIAIQYKLKPVKLESVNYNYNLNGNLTANFSFSAEIDVNNLNKGLFISGLLNTPFPIIPYYFLLLQDNKGGMLLTDTDNPIIISKLPVI